MDIDAAYSVQGWLVALLHPDVLAGGGEIPSLPANTEVDALLACISRHRVAGLAWHAVAGRADVLPDTLVDGMREAARQNAHQGLANAAALVRIHAALQARDINALPLKGPVLGQQLHGEPGLRHAGDVDVLVPEARLQKADEVLQEIGYRRESPGAGYHGPRWRLYHWASHQASYWQDEDGAAVELHWRLHAVPSLQPLGDWVSRANGGQTVALAGAELPVFAPVEQLLYLCAHGARSHWHRLQWLCDLPPLLAQIVAADEIAEFRQRVRATGLERTVVQALLLCERLWPGMEPAPMQFIREGSKTDRATASLVAVALDGMATPDSKPPRSLRQIFIHLLADLRLKRCWRYRWQYLSRLLVNTDELEQSNLPGRLIYLYPLLRPWLWLKRKALSR